MKKIFIVFLMALLTVSLISTFNVEAATYQETGDPGIIANNDYQTAEYISSDYFDDSYCYMYSFSYPCLKTQIEGYIDSGGEGLKDHYSFYIPYDTRLRITNSSEYSNGEYIYGNINYNLYRVDEGFRLGEIYDERMPESSLISQDNITINQGIPVEAGYYVISYDYNDNDTPITREVTGWFGITYNKNYYVEEYHFSVSYLHKPSDFTDTSKTIYESKLDSDSAAVWVNDNKYEDLYFSNPNYASRNLLEDDFEAYIGHDMANTVLDKRVYILSDDMLEFTKTYIQSFKSVLEEANELYEENVDEGIWGLGNWYVVLGMTEQQGEDVEFVIDQIKSKFVDTLALGTPAGVALAAIDHLMTNQIQDMWEAHQYLIMVFAVQSAMEIYPSAELEAHPELFIHFYLTLNQLFGDMIENPDALGDVINTLSYLDGALSAMSETIDGDEDFLCYFDILINYEYEAPEIDPLSYPNPKYTTPRFKKNYSLREFNTSETKYLNIMTGSISQGDSLFSGELQEDYVISENIIYNGVNYHGELTYTSLYEDYSNFSFDGVYVENDNAYALYGTGDEASMRFSTSYISGDDDKLLDGIYAIHPQYGFLEVTVDVGPRTIVSSTTVGYVTTTVYRYNITYYIVNPTGGAPYEIDEFSGYITYTNTVDRTPSEPLPGDITIVSF